MTRPQLLAFYLPQFHPIPENDAWWGRGFTEWTNVVAARPLFPGHHQPHLPADLGFYDLRLPEARQAQADLAREYGVSAFCYYHYWFNGRRLLGRPIDEVLASGRPDFPFLMCWANEPWTRAWDGLNEQVLMPQAYSEEDDRRHARWLATAFRDERYFRVDGKPLFLVYRASQLPDASRTASIWREEAERLGVGEIYLCRVESFVDERSDPASIGFDAAVEFQPDWANLGPPRPSSRGVREALRSRRSPSALRVYGYADVVDRMIARPDQDYRRFACVTPSWDNTARQGHGGVVLHGSEPGQYERWLRDAVARSAASGSGDRIVFVNAWNEWAEGSHLEPDRHHGLGFLEATQRVVCRAR